MSNIYIQEPPTSGKVLLKTTVGDIDVELWTREAPKACRNFIQLCLEGYYNGTIFHRVVKGFIVQGGDPNGDGTGGESIYGEPFKDEFHTRLRFTRRGLLAMANAGKDDNASQFFFTMGATPELQNKHTIFGKVTGETIYNMLKLEDGLIDHDERPQYPNKVLKTEVLLNPFKDIVPRVTEQKEVKDKTQKKEKKTGVKNFKLLSFGEEAEEDEELASVANEKFSGKSKSTHDLLDDPKLSSLPAVETDDDKKRDISEVELHQEELESIRKKLKGSDSSKKLKPSRSSSKIVEVEEKDEDDDEEDEEEYYFGKDRHDEKKKKMENIRKEIRDLKKDFQENKKKNIEETQKTETERTKRSETLQEYDDTIVKYAEKQKTLPKKGASREQFTLELLKKFQQKLGAAKEKIGEDEDAQKKPLDDEDEENEDDTWLAHKLSFADNVPVLARDANTKDDTWYDLNDPRNPINKRRREESKKMLHKKGGSGSGSSSGHSRHRR